jgi:hypothetical protein
VVAIGDVLSAPQHQPGVDPGFEFVCDVEINMKKNQLSEGVALEELNVPGTRDLRRSIQRHSHIRLTDEEFDQALRALRLSV